MRWLMPMMVVLSLCAGCMFEEPTTTVPRNTDHEALPDAKKPEGGTPGNPIIPRAGGGSGGAAQAVRGAATRIVAMGDMKNLHTFINTASLGSGQMPSKQEIQQAAKAGDPKLAGQIDQGDIVLTGTQQREGIWAYTKNAHNGQYIVASQSGVERVSGPDLQRRLQQQ